MAADYKDKKGMSFQMMREKARAGRFGKKPNPDDKFHTPWQETAPSVGLPDDVKSMAAGGSINLPGEAGQNGRGTKR